MRSERLSAGRLVCVACALASGAGLVGAILLRLSLALTLGCLGSFAACAAAITGIRTPAWARPPPLGERLWPLAAGRRPPS